MDNRGLLSLRSVFSKPVKKSEIKWAVEHGMIPKKDLISFRWYKGICRNSNVALWVADINKFFYVRVKFDKVYAEEINHPEDDDGYDLFIPYEEIS